MRRAQISTPGGLGLQVAVAGGYLDVADATGDPELAAIGWVLAAGQPVMDAIRLVAGRDGSEVPEADFGPAVPEPPRILCLGVNYSEHAIEGSRSVPTWPEAFVRGSASVIGPYADLVRPALTSCFDYEGELGVVIGSGGRYIKAQDAMAAIAGFVVLNDATAREWQRAATQWTAGKNFDSSMPAGRDPASPDEGDIADVGRTPAPTRPPRQPAMASQTTLDRLHTVGL